MITSFFCALCSLDYDHLHRYPFCFTDPIYSSSGAEKGCVILKQPTLKWMPEDCSAVKDFICEQTRCYYYNYGSIPVSSAQG